MTARDLTLTREELLNNPGGIVHGPDKWLGMTEDQPDAKLVKFQPGYGIRALARNVRSYQREGITTFTAFAAKWAPRRDNNDPVAYAQFLADFCNWHPDTPVVFETIMLTMVKGVITRENGRCLYSDDFLQRWISPSGVKPMTALTPETPAPAPAAEPKPTTWLSNLLHASVAKSASAGIGAWLATLVIGAIGDFLPQVHMTDQKEVAITGICVFLCSHIIKDPS